MDLGISILIVLLVILILAVFLAFAWYRIVPPSEAHLVVTPRSRFVVSPDENVATNKRKTYFAIPNFIPFFGRVVRQLDVTIKELVIEQETYEKNQARYMVKSSTKYRISDVRQAAETFINNEELKKQLVEVIRASVRAITVKYDVVDARASKKKMEEEIRAEMTDDLNKWGLNLVNFQLVDFQDTEDSAIISDISKRREKEIEAVTRERNAEKEKSARVKEAESDEKARQREIERDQKVGEQEQLKLQKISEQQKLAKEKEYSVIEVETVRQAEINKKQAQIDAEKQKDVARVIREEQHLIGEGEKLRLQEVAKGNAAGVREKGFAEADALDKKQIALNKFGDAAIRALTAEQIVAMQQEVGVAAAKALERANVRVFAGGEGDGKQGFDLGKMISAVTVSNDETANAVMNRIARPHDLGLSALALKEATKRNDKPKENKKQKK